MAKFNSAWLISKRQFRSLTGIETGTSRALVDRLRPHWRERIVAPKNRPGRPWGVGGLEDQLLVLLILYRCAITPLVLISQVNLRNHVTAFGANF
jgi:hypothetical protein